MKDKVVTRIPPSPTGRFHIGTARTALFNYLYARHNDGQFLLRSEDTDRARSTREFEQEIIEGLEWLGLTSDSFSRQSENAARHKELLERLVADGTAYVSEEESKDTPGALVHLVRLKNAGQSITFADVVRGDITFDTTELGDFVIARGIDDPLYHFAVVVDDWDSGVTHVIRGEDHISNTPRQILIQEALGAPRPIYAHLPLIVDAKRAKLSKRSGATSVMDYREEGFLPEALVNYLALLGWSPGSDREDFSLAELIEAFSLDGIQKGGAAWDREKLLSVNQRWMRKLSDAEFIANGGLKAPSEHVLQQLVPMLKERARTFSEARDMLTGEFAFFFAPPEITKELLVAKEPTGRSGVGERGLEACLEALESLPDPLSPEEAKDALMPLADAEEARGKGGRGAVLWPLRYALSGQEKSPDPFTIIFILGRSEAIRRIKNAIAILRG